MQYNVAQLLKAPIGSTKQVTILEHQAALDDLPLAGPIEGEVQLLRTDAGILVRGDVSTEIRLECSRCLAPTLRFVVARLEEEFSTAQEAAKRRQEDDEPDDPVLLIDEHNTLDLSDLVRQQLLLELPDHPLCRADCAGMCPECGQDLNVASCDCVPEGDPRWNALAQLQQQDESSDIVQGDDLGD